MTEHGVLLNLAKLTPAYAGLAISAFVPPLQVVSLVLTIAYTGYMFRRDYLKRKREESQKKTDDPQA